MVFNIQALDHFPSLGTSDVCLSTFPTRNARKKEALRALVRTTGHKHKHKNIKTWRSFYAYAYAYIAVMIGDVVDIRRSVSISKNLR